VSENRNDPDRLLRVLLWIGRFIPSMHVSQRWLGGFYVASAAVLTDLLCSQPRLGVILGFAYVGLAEVIEGV